MECQKAPLKKLNNGSFKAVVNLEACVSHEFRYIVVGVCLNDTAADAYVWNEFAGSKNDVLF